MLLSKLCLNVGIIYLYEGRRELAGGEEMMGSHKGLTELVRGLDVLESYLEDLGRGVEDLR